MRSTPSLLAAAAAAALLAAGTTPAAAQAAPAAAPQQVPDLNGIWVVADSFMDKQDGTSPSALGRVDPDRPSIIRAANQPQLKGEYLKRQQEVQARLAKNLPVAEPTAACLPQGMPRFWEGPYAWEIIQTPRQINMYQEWNEQTRRIYLDGRKHPSLDDVDPLYNGHSVGHWEGDTLVVDTVNLPADTLLNRPGTFHSDKMHIAERIRPVGPDLLEVSMTVTDPEALAQPWTWTRKLRRKPGMEIQDYVCAQNNRNAGEAHLDAK